MSPIDLDDIAARLDTVLAHLDETEKAFEAHIARAHPEQRAGARNLVHYTAFRRFDMRELQESLASLGLSSLGRAEGRVKPTLTAVRRTLEALRGRVGRDPTDEVESFSSGRLALRRNTEALFGRPGRQRLNPIMVTLPSDAAERYESVERLVVSGMDVARINCAHDDEALWSRMIANVRKAAESHGRRCPVLMDVGGPKIRTGALARRPRVLRVRPARNHLGQVVRPGRVRLVPETDAPPPPDALPVDPAWLRRAVVGDRIRFRDTRAKKRRLQVVAVDAGGVLAETVSTVYVASGVPLHLKDEAGNSKGYAAVGTLPEVEIPLVLRPGDGLLLTRSPQPGVNARVAEDGSVLEPARVSCTLPLAIDDARAGETVLLDDGRIAAKILSSSAEALELAVTRADPSGSKLRGDKGINFPDSRLSVRGLTERDRHDLAFIARHADAVGMSFVREPADVASLQEALSGLGAKIGIVLKIETRQGFDNLPLILLEAMRSCPVGVMIARGDLAIECGWERLAELQEEILWLCEAAHLPAVWATQVLEHQTKQGYPSRPEITDAAMAQRAECIMLGKGEHINEAIAMLDDILGRMQEHQDKKSSRLRKLAVSAAVER